MQQASRMAEKASDTMHDVADRVMEQGKEAAHRCRMLPAPCRAPSHNR